VTLLLLLYCSPEMQICPGYNYMRLPRGCFRLERFFLCSTLPFFHAAAAAAAASAAAAEKAAWMTQFSFSEMCLGQ
jgi:hypothetical protein